MNYKNTLENAIMDGIQNTLENRGYFVRAVNITKGLTGVGENPESVDFIDEIVSFRLRARIK